MRIDLSVVDPIYHRLGPSRVSAGEVVYPPGGRLGPRWQHDLALVLVHSGSATVNVDGVARPPLGEGSVGLLLPGHREEISFATSGTTHHSWVSGRLAEPPPQLVARFASLPRAIRASTALAVLVREAVTAARNPQSSASPLIGALAEAALWRYISDAESGSDHPGHGVVDRARLYIDARVGDPNLDLRRVAAAVEVSAPHLVRRFKTELGITPMAYLWERRSAAAIDLLAHTGLSVGEIATRTGFKSVYHFSRKIREHAGRAPTEVRKLRWKQA
jgi:AraC family transcriptional regulator, arabinose operon regulatory protein